MKKNYLKLFLVLIAMVTFSFNNMQAQITYGSGTLTNNCTSPAGTTGTNCTFLGCGASGYGGGGLNNIFIGENAGYYTGVYQNNLGIGVDALYLQNGNAAYNWNTYNTAIGNWALYSTNCTTNGNGNDNTALGDHALFTNGIGSDNTACGFKAGYYFTGSQNCFFGSRAGLGTSESTGTNNVFIGCSSGLANTQGTYNTFIGCTAGIGNQTGNDNTFIGENAGSSNNASSCTFVGSNAGSGNNAANNTFLGYYAGYLTTGTDNTATGYNALFNNSGTGTGNYNVANGYESLFNNYGNYNVAMGFSSGVTNTTGGGNAFFGYDAGYSNSTGGSNTCIGIEAGYSNTSNSYGTFIGAVAGFHSYGDYNTCLGYASGYNTTNGSDNTFIGLDAGNSNTTGNDNIYIGAYSGGNANNLSNATAIGEGATATASNQVMVGNASQTSVCGYGPWTNISDGRFKINIQNNVKGLEFINKLHPVTYQLDTKAINNFVTQNLPDSIKDLQQAGMNFANATAIIHSGFIAQSVDSAANACGFKSSIVHKPENSADPYALSYSEIVVPLVKAVQELSKEVDSLKAANKKGATYRSNNNTDNDEQGDAASINNIELANNAVLYQNAPNPFGNGTTIKYFVPVNADAQIVFYDEFGTQLKTFKVSENGTGQLKIDASNLSAGMYSYSLVVNGKVIDTKKMMCNK